MLKSSFLRQPYKNRSVPQERAAAEGTLAFHGVWGAQHASFGKRFHSIFLHPFVHSTARRLTPPAPSATLGPTTRHEVTVYVRTGQRSLWPLSCRAAEGEGSHPAPAGRKVVRLRQSCQQMGARSFPKLKIPPAHAPCSLLPPSLLLNHERSPVAAKIATPAPSAHD